METNQPLDLGNEDAFRLNATAISHLRSTARWAFFLSILGFIGVGFMAIGGVASAAMFSFMSDTMGNSPMPFPPALFSIFYFILAVVYFFPVLYLYRFSSQTQTAVQQEDPEALNDALSNLNAHYKFIGILSIALIGLYVIGMIVAFAVGFSTLSGF